MIYVIYHIDTTLAIKHLNTFESGAKRSVTCMNRNAGSIQYAYASLEDYETKVVTTKKVKSLMTTVVSNPRVWYHDLQHSPGPNWTALARRF